MRLRDSGAQLIALIGLLDNRPELLGQLSLRDLGKTSITCALGDKYWMESTNPEHQHRLNFRVTG